MLGAKLAGTVAVKTEVDSINRSQKFLYMLGRHRRAKCRARFGKTRLRQLNHVHVAFADNGAMLLANTCGSFVQTVDFTTLVIERRLGTVEVLGMLVAVEGSSTKRNHLSARITDWKHQATAETIIAFVAIVDHQAATAFFLQIFAGVLIAENILKRLPGIRRISQRKASGSLARDAALFQILNGAGIRLQTCAVIV